MGTTADPLECVSLSIVLAGLLAVPLQGMLIMGTRMMSATPGSMAWSCARFGVGANLFLFLFMICGNAWCWYRLNHPKQAGRKLTDPSPPDLDRRTATEDCPRVPCGQALGSPATTGRASYRMGGEAPRDVKRPERFEPCRRRGSTSAPVRPPQAVQANESPDATIHACSEETP